MSEPQSLNREIEKLLSVSVEALKQQGIVPGEVEPEVQVERAKDPSHGDVATNLAMRLAKPCRQKPRDLADQLLSHLPEAALLGKAEVAGPGFINFFFDVDWLARRVETMAQSNRAAVEPASSPKRVIVDYSAPNVAKEMHVGHIRSTIIGDAIARSLEFLGHEVIRANHIGDWGTQFGMLIAHLEELEGKEGGASDRGGGKNYDAALDAELSDLEEFYRESKRRYDSDEKFAEKARAYVVRLQGGDPWCLSRWQRLVDVTMTQNQVCYDRLNVTLTRNDTMGESLYNDMLPAIVEDLLARGIAVEDQGAVVVFLDEYQAKDGTPMGVIIRKRDGGYLYSTTDIACARYRYEQLEADRIMYCIDSRQAQHLQQAWTIARKADYLPERVTTEHHAFGMMLGKDGKPFKTREGGTIKLVNLLQEAQERAQRLIESKNPDLDPAELSDISESVGIGAVKYADLSKNRNTDYVFDWDTMLSFDGNTAPYLQYAHTRIRSVLQKADFDPSKSDEPVKLTEDAELMLARTLIWFSDAIDSVVDNGFPHVLCGYLYDLARQFTRFYESCPITKEDVSPQVRASRVKLCVATSNVLEIGLGLLGIVALEKM